MADTQDLPAWIALFVGVYSLAAGLGEFRSPGGWKAMLEDFEHMPALRFLTGIVLLLLGALIYLASPWRPDDWLALLVTVLGGIVLIEGALFLSNSTIMLTVSRRLMSRPSRTWALIAMAIGATLIAAGLFRLFS